MQPHPAPFSKPILDRLREMLAGTTRARVLDPFAGTGRVLCAVPPSAKLITLIEIEQEFVDEGLAWLRTKGWLDSWDRPEGSNAHLDFITADSSAWLRRNKRTFTHIVTSPTYGNRMMDPYRPNPDVVCRSYAQSKGGPLLDNNTGKYKLDDPRYRDLNLSVMAAAVRRLEDGGQVIVNVSDFYRTFKKGQPPLRCDVIGFWIDMMRQLPVTLEGLERVYTRRFKHGENRHRVPYEYLVTFRKD